MTGVTTALPKLSFQDQLGLPLAGGSVQVYLAGTTTPTPTWLDRDQTSLNTNPIILDSRGECVIWLDPTLFYKFLIKNSVGATIGTVDNIYGTASAATFMSSVGAGYIGYLPAGTGAVATTVQSKLQELAVCPDDFPGTDQQRVQQAFNDAITRNASIVLNRLYDLTGGTITITKDATGYTRIQTRVIGVNGGGFSKSDAGFMFTAAADSTSDFTFQSVHFEGVLTTPCDVFECPKLIRIYTTDCFFHKLGHIFKAVTTSYIQSCRSVGDKVLKCSGYVFSAGGVYDSTLDHALIESGTGGILYLTYHGGNYNGAFSLRIINSICEGMTNPLPIIHLTKQIKGCKIDANYFEANSGKHIVFEYNATNRTDIWDVEISSNTHSGASGSTTSTALIEWAGNVIRAYSHNNTTSDLYVHDTTLVVAGSRVYSVMDGCSVTFPSVANPNKLDAATTSLIDAVRGPFEGDTYLNGQTYGYKRALGQVTVYHALATSIVFTSLESKVVQLTFPIDLAKDDIISVHAQTTYEVVIQNFSINATKTILDVYVKNGIAAGITVTAIRATIMRPGFTLTG